MAKLLALLILLAAGTVQVRVQSAGSPSNAAETEFNKLREESIAGYLAWRPQTGTTLGLHEYDGKLTDYSRPSLDAELARLTRFDQQLATLDAKLLSPQAHYDLRILQTAIKNEIFQFEDVDGYRKNPMTYAGVLEVNIYIKRNFAPIEARLRSIIAIEEQTPKLIATAKANLEESLAKPFVETAIEVANGSADFLSKDLVEALKEVENEQLLTAFNAVNQRTIEQLRSYVTWLKGEKLPKAHTHYALGREKFQKMLRYGELIDLAPERILEIGMRELRREQQVFADTAKKIDPGKKPIEVFKEIQKDHPNEKGLIPDTKKDLEAIRRFVVDRRIVAIPSEVRARVEETPQYLRATSFASMDTPGPFEAKATEAYYYVTPVEKDWSPRQKEEWLTAFNYYTTDVVTIHEAYPGHYVQFLCLNASPATKLEKIFGSYAFIEGWAHYCEQMMVDEGFGAAKAIHSRRQNTGWRNRTKRCCVCAACASPSKRTAKGCRWTTPRSFSRKTVITNTSRRIRRRCAGHSIRSISITPWANWRFSSCAVIISNRKAPVSR
ncbi:MAG: DUF885 domain-containing protein [Verrucomicrobia bacterium]|nr:MAG: DUF885 domain-containing protein [Verrucomicrobiota bacterium]